MFVEGRKSYGFLRGSESTTRLEERDGDVRRGSGEERKESRIRRRLLSRRCVRVATV